MTQTSNRILDEVAKVMTDAAGVAQGVRREVEGAVRAQAERFVGDMDLVKREDFDIAKDMAARALDRLDAIEERLTALETRLAALDKPAGKAKPASPSKTDCRRRLFPNERIGMCASAQGPVV